MDPNFIAFNAHWGFAFFVMTQAHGSWTMAVVGVLLAAGKEFWFDPRYEVGQNFKDGLMDFAGYLTGIILGLM